MELWETNLWGETCKDFASCSLQVGFHVCGDNLLVSAGLVESCKETFLKHPVLADLLIFLDLYFLSLCLWSSFGLLLWRRISLVLGP